MVGGGIQQVEAARIIKDNGYNLLVTDKEARAHCREYADHFSEIDGKNVIEIASYINKEKKKFQHCGNFNAYGIGGNCCKSCKDLQVTRG